MRIRPMEEEDVPGVMDAAWEAFTDLDVRLGEPHAPPRRDPERAALRYRRPMTTDPGGAWVADDDGRVAGAALAILRDGVWGLSLLVVVPDAQSSGVGRELLQRAWAYGAEARGHIILASPDVRALRSYVKLGLDLHPAVRAKGRPRGVVAPGGLRPWQADDHEWAGPLARELRGAAHGEDLDAAVERGIELLVLPERGYAGVYDDELVLLAAEDDSAAQALLAGYLAGVGDGEATVEWVTSQQQWAVRACVRAGLELHPFGAVLTGGTLGRMTPYLPNGAYL
jgi:GNAT superfamily N-acetyltransferase